MSDLHRSDELADGLIRKWAGAIRRSKLTGVAVLALELLKPAGFVASQVLTIAEPLLKPLIGQSSRDYARFLENPTNIERLLETLEDRPEPPS
jgi:hypothetical protein